MQKRQKDKKKLKKKTTVKPATEAESSSEGKTATTTMVTEEGNFLKKDSLSKLKAAAKQSNDDGSVVVVSQLRKKSMQLQATSRASEQGDSKKEYYKMRSKLESQITRANAKNKEYCNFFALPDSEELIEEFNCALHKKILLQGKMYIFSSHVCFYSNVFGYITKRSLPLKDVTSISKAKNVGFPNSIRIVYMGKQMFFTSFLSRDEAYKLIVNLL